MCVQVVCELVAFQECIEKLERWRRETAVRTAKVSTFRTELAECKTLWMAFKRTAQAERSLIATSSPARIAAAQETVKAKSDFHKNLPAFKEPHMIPRMHPTPGKALRRWSL